MKNLLLLLFLISFSYLSYANDVNWVKSGLGLSKPYAHSNLIDGSHFINGKILYLNTIDGIQSIDIETCNLIKYYQNGWYRASFIKSDTLIYLNSYYDDSSINLIDNNTKEIFYTDTIKFNNKNVYFHGTSDISPSNNMLVVLARTGKINDAEYHLVFWNIKKKQTEFVFDIEDEINDIKFLNDSSIVISNSGLEFYKIKNNTLVFENELVCNSSLITINKDFEFLCTVHKGYPEHYLRIYNLNNYQQQKEILVHNDFKLTNIFGDSDIIAYTNTSGESIIYDLGTNTIISKFETDYNPTSYMFFEDDNIITFSSIEGRVDIYNYNTKKFVKSLIANPTRSDLLVMSDNEKYLFSICLKCNRKNGDDVISILNIESGKVINSSMGVFFNYNIDGSRADISNYSEKVVMTDMQYGYIWDYQTDKMLIIGYKGTNVSDVCCNPVKDEFLISTEDGQIFLYDYLLNQTHKYEIGLDYKILSVMYNKSGTKVFAFIYNNESYCIPYEIDLESKEVDVHYDLKIQTEYFNDKVKFSNLYNRYYCNKYNIFDTENRNIIVLPINSYSTYYPKSTTVSDDLKYVFYIPNGVYGDFAKLFSINGKNSEQLQPAYTYNLYSILSDFFNGSTLDGSVLEPVNAVIKNNTEIIMSLHNGMLVSMNLQDTLKTSYREVSQNGEALISEFYNYDDILTIEVNPDINRQINYQISDISGNTIQKGTLPEGISHEQINFFGHPKSSYFIMFHTETSKQIFKFIN